MLDGCWMVEILMDYDGVEIEKQCCFVCMVEIDGDEMCVDFSGMDGMVIGLINILLIGV